jgi:hypothetical protein
MWRIWTRGWGPRDWWYWFRMEGFPFWVARHLPKRVLLWAFIHVYAKDGQSPGPEYCRVYDHWESVHNLNPYRKAILEAEQGHGL